MPRLAAIGKATRQRQINGTNSCETADHLLSTVLSPAPRFGEIVRAHWGIENSLHWVLDVTMNEDQSLQPQEYNGPQNLALLRRWALNACKLEDQRVRSGKSKQAVSNDDFLGHACSLSQPSQMR